MPVEGSTSAMLPVGTVRITFFSSLIIFATTRLKGGKTKKLLFPDNGKIPVAHAIGSGCQETKCGSSAIVLLANKFSFGMRNVSLIFLKMVVYNCHSVASSNFLECKYASPLLFPDVCAAKKSSKS